MLNTATFVNEAEVESPFFPLCTSLPRAHVDDAEPLSDESNLASPKLSRVGIPIEPQPGSGNVCGRPFQVQHARQPSSATSIRSGTAFASEETPNEFNFFGSTSFASTPPTSVGSMSPLRCKCSQPTDLCEEHDSIGNAAAAQAVRKDIFNGPDACQSHCAMPHHSLLASSNDENPTRSRVAPLYLDSALQMCHESSLFAEQLQQVSPRTLAPSLMPCQANTLATLSDGPPVYTLREELPLYSDHQHDARSSSASHRIRQAVALRVASSKLVPSRLSARLAVVLSGQDEAEGEAKHYIHTGSSFPRPAAERLNLAPEPNKHGGFLSQSVALQSRPRVSHTRTLTASKFIAGTRMGPTPSLSLSWRLDDEAVSLRSEKRLDTDLVPSNGFFSRLGARKGVHVTRNVHSVASSVPHSRTTCRLDSPSWPFSHVDRILPSTSKLATPSEVPYSLSRSLSTQGPKLLQVRRQAALVTSVSDVPARPRSEGRGDANLSRSNSNGSTDVDDQPPAALHEEGALRGALIYGRSHGCETRRPLLLEAALHGPISSAFLASPPCCIGARLEGKTKRSCASFITRMPREIQVKIIREMIDLYVKDHQRSVESGTWRGSIARTRSAVGYEQAVKDLVSMASVCKTFQSLVLDGQLWRCVDTTSLSICGPPTITRIVTSAGRFVRRLDLSGLKSLSSENLKEITAALCGEEQGGSRANHLMDLNLSGLPQLTEQSIADLFASSTDLRILTVKDLPQLGHWTFQCLSHWCPRVQELDITRCSAITAESVALWLSELDLTARRQFRVLKAAGLADVSEHLMNLIAENLTGLEVLDLSYARQLDDRCVSAFVTHIGDGSCNAESDRSWPSFFELTARQAAKQGLSLASDNRHYRRRFPCLRQLSLSSTSISDRSCMSLAWGTLPYLEILELADNQHLRDEGLVELLSSLPYIRRLDLEGAVHLSQDVILSLTPPVTEDPDDIFTETRHARSRDANSPVPGSQLTHLILSEVFRVDNTLKTLVQSCSKLRHLEVDSTRVSDEFAKWFVDVMRERRAADITSSTKSGANTAKSPYLSVIDCGHMTRHGCNSILATGIIRPRIGYRSPALRHLNYGDADELLPLTQNLVLADQYRNMLDDECNEERICVKSFWYWQALDRKERESKKKKIETKRSAKLFGLDAHSAGFASFALGGRRRAEGGASLSRSSNRLIERALNDRRHERAAVGNNAGHDEGSRLEINTSVSSSRLGRLLSHSLALAAGSQRGEEEDPDSHSDTSEEDIDHGARQLCTII